MINLEVVDEEMVCIRRLDSAIPASFIASITRDRPDWRCLPSIDPYGMTVFNQVQVPWLIRELEEVLARNDLDAPRSALKELKDAAEWVATEVHTYIRCVGD